MNSEKIKFNNKEGQELSASLEWPTDGQPQAFALFAHCFTCSKNLAAVINISRALTLNQIAVLRFDFTGLGQSSGDFSETNFSTNVSDLVSAYNILNSQYSAPAILIGHSLGGAAVLAAASAMKAVKAVVTIGAPAEPTHVQRLFKESLKDIKLSGEATVSIGGRPFKIKKQLLLDLEKTTLKNRLKKLGKALLVLHSPQDKIVEVANARKIYEAAMHPKSFITLDGADHLLTNKEDSIYVASIITTWASRYVEWKKDNGSSGQHQVIVRTGDDGFTTEVKAGNHAFLADEPEAFGGKNLGPSPYDYLLTALGTCTSMTLRMYADRKKWPLTKVKVYLRHKKTHADDCENCDDSGAKLDQITRVIEIMGNLADDQKKRLLEIADKCPVHKTLEGDISVKTTLKK